MNTSDFPSSPQSPYDPDGETGESDLWFLPAPEEPTPEDLPWAEANNTSLFDPEVWQAAEGQGVQILASAVAALVRLDERLANLPEDRRAGMARRLAIHQAREFLWAEGVRLAPDQLALWLVLRQPSDDLAQTLSQADWAVRRLTGKAHPAEGLEDFVERRLQVEETGPEAIQDLFAASRGEAFLERAGQWQSIMAEAQVLHPLTQGAMAALAWVALELSAPDERLEADVAAAKWVVANDGLRLKALPFAPLATLSGGVSMMLFDGPGKALTRLLMRIEEGAMTALRQLDQLKSWQSRAEKAVSDLSGRTPSLLLDALAANPVLSVPMGVKLTGSTQPTVLRNLNIFVERDLIYETTGQGRYRFWAVKG